VPPATFSISGRVTAGGNGLAGVTLAAGAQTAETAGDGSYSFSGLSAGSYTVTASKSGYTLSAAQTVSVGPDKTGINFTAAPVPVQPAATFSISGTVRVDGKALAGATVTVPGKGSLSTGPDGGYRFTDLPAGSYTVTAEAPNCSFSPRAVTVGPDQAGVDFSNRARYSIGGKVLIRKKGVAGVTVMVVGTDRTLLTAAGGVYAFGGLSAGTYTVTAKKGKRVFPKRVVRIGPSQTRVMLALKK
jgi:hypothetical protein